MVSRDDSCSIIHLVDSTLRDGEQAAGVVLSQDDKIRIASMLSAMGVGELEIGCPSNDPAEIQAAGELLSMGLSSQITVWCRARKEDLDLAAEVGAHAVHISLPTSDIHLQALQKDHLWVMDQIKNLVPYARQRFEFVSIGLQDASRVDVAFLYQLFRLSEQTGVNRIRLADTVGVWDPIQTHHVIEQLHTQFPDLTIGFHAHNDLGMATANAIAAIRAGATDIDVTVNGLGERAGNASLDEVVMACRVILRLDCGIDVGRLMEIGDLVGQLAGRPVPFQKPVTGKGVFLHESGVHVHAMLRDCRSYEAFLPESIGRHREEYVIGSHSGRAAVRMAIDRWGFSVPAFRERQLMGMIRHNAIEKKRALTKEEIQSLCMRMNSHE